RAEGVHRGGLSGERRQGGATPDREARRPPRHEAPGVGDGSSVRSSIVVSYGGGGIRTPVWFPTHRFRGGPVWPTPAPLHHLVSGEPASPGSFHRGARIRTGDLCDP